MTSLHDQVADAFRILQGLHDDNAEYARINNLGGFDNHFMKQARAALSSAPALLARIREMEWQPIETAPKDGTRFIAGHHKVRITQPNYFEFYIAVYAKECSIPTDDEEWGVEGNDGEFYCPEGFYREAQDRYGDEQYLAVKPTHWMPLLPPPKPKAPEEM